MSGNLTPAELAELRLACENASYESYREGSNLGWSDLGGEVPRLLDEIEQKRAELERTQAALTAGNRRLQQAIEQAQEAQADRNAAEAKLKKWSELGPWWAVQTDCGDPVLAGPDCTRRLLTNDREEAETIAYDTEGAVVQYPEGGGE